MATEKTEAVEKEAPDLEDKVADTDDDDEVTAEADGQVVVRTRKEKRAERSRSRHEELLTELRKTREDAEQARRDAAEARALAARGYQQQPQQAAQTQVDPYKAKVGDIRSEQEGIQMTFRSGRLTDVAEAERLRKRYYDLEDKLEELREEKVERRLASKLPPPRQEGEYEEKVLRDEFPEVVGNQQATRYAVGVYQTLVAEGKPPTLATSREAMRKAGERFGLYETKAPPVSDTTRQKFGGVPAQAGSRTSSVDTRLNKAQQKMALAAFPNETSDNKAYARWAEMFNKSQRE